MQSYSLEEIRDRQGKVLEQATVEPVLLTEGSQPRYVILSTQNYQELMMRLSALEELALGQQAEAALHHSQMVGSNRFMAELQHLATLDHE